MKFIEYNLTDKNGNSNCVIRSLCKILNKEYDDVLNGLLDTAKALNNESFNDIPVFEEYMKQNNIIYWMLEFKPFSNICDPQLQLHIPQLHFSETEFVVLNFLLLELILATIISIYPPLIYNNSKSK